MVSGQQELVNTPAAKARSAIRFLIGASVFIHIADRVDDSNAVCPDTRLAGFLPRHNGPDGMLVHPSSILHRKVRNYRAVKFRAKLQQYRYCNDSDEPHIKR